MHQIGTTLTQFILEEQRKYSGATGEFSCVLNDIALACKKIAALTSKGDLIGVLGSAGSENVQGEEQKKMDIITNDVMIEALSRGHTAALASEEMDEVYDLPKHIPRGHYLVTFDPLDGSSNIDVNVSIGTIFRVLRKPTEDRCVEERDFLQPGNQQVAAGYCVYGPQTTLVLTVGDGVAMFTLDREQGSFFLTQDKVTIPADTKEFAINMSNMRHWDAPMKRYIDECLAGTEGPCGKDFNMRWVASMAAETHRILMRGGVFMYPRDTRDPAKPAKLRLLYEANPIAFLVEQAGGRASTGYEPVLQVQPKGIHQRIGLICGSRSEVERIERYHEEKTHDAPLRSPLFAERGLFRH